ncbi:hypothetical protein GOODEAATRI_004889, partial [Goodea atripinnis]
KVNLEKPLHLVIGSISPTAVLLSWGNHLKTPYEKNIMNECLEDGFYTIRYRERNRNWIYQTCPTSDTVIDHLKPDTQYEFGVRPNKDDRNSYDHCTSLLSIPEKENNLRINRTRPADRLNPTLPKILPTTAPRANITASSVTNPPSNGDLLHGQTPKAPSSAPGKRPNPAAPGVIWTSSPASGLAIRGSLALSVCSSCSASSELFLFPGLAVPTQHLPFRPISSSVCMFTLSFSHGCLSPFNSSFSDCGFKNIRAERLVVIIIPSFTCLLPKLNIIWWSITNVIAQGCCKLTVFPSQIRNTSNCNPDTATVLHVLGQGSKRNVSPSLPMKPSRPAASTVSMRHASRNPLYPMSNGFRQLHSSSRSSNSSPTSGILGGNPPLTFYLHFAL